MSRTVVGVFSLARPSRKLDSGADRSILLRETDLSEALRARGYEVIPGGAPYAEEDRLAASQAMARRHAHTLMDFSPASVILNASADPRAADVIESLHYLERELAAPLRLILFVDVREPRAEAIAMEIGGALRAAGWAYCRAVGRPDDSAFIDAIAAVIDFHGLRAAWAPHANETLRLLKRQKIVAYGLVEDRDTYDPFDADALTSRFGVGFEHRALAVLEERAYRMRFGPEGETVYDPRVLDAFAKSRTRLANADKAAERALMRHLAIYFATWDDVMDAEATAALLAIAPERRFTPQRLDLTAAWLSDAVGPEDLPKDRVPAITRARPNAVFTALFAGIAAKAPAGFAAILDRSPSAVRLEFAALPRDAYADAPLIDADKGGLIGRLRTGCDATLVRIGRAGGKWTLFAAEGRSAERDQGSWIECAGPAEAAFSEWPTADAIVLGGAHAPVLVECAARANIGWTVIDRRGVLHCRAGR